MIAGCIVVDLTAEPPVGSSRDRRRLDVLNRCPDGARVLVDIGDRKFVTQDAAGFLHDHDHRLAIEIVGADPDAVRLFVRAAREGAWEATS